MDITINLTTFNRYNTTLPLCLMSILNQTLLPKEIILVDDNIKKDFYNIPLYKEFLNLCKLKNIKFSYYYGESKGQVFAQMIAFNNTETPYILKIDDDNILNPNTLEILYNTITQSEDIGMVSGLILSKDDIQREIQYKSDIYNKIEDIFTYFNIQMCGNQDNNIKEVEHIYSNYLFRKNLTNGYNLEFAPAGHREDTVFSYEFYRNGYKLLINPQAVSYHLHSDGGNRLYSDKLNNNNDIKFIEKLKKWGIIPNKLQLYEDNEKVYTKKYNQDWLIYKK